jgi:hypothetical protein
MSSTISTDPIDAASQSAIRLSSFVIGIRFLIGIRRWKQDEFVLADFDVRLASGV